MLTAVCAVQCSQRLTVKHTHTHTLSQWQLALCSVTQLWLKTSINNSFFESRSRDPETHVLEWIFSRKWKAFSLFISLTYAELSFKAWGVWGNTASAASFQIPNSFLLQSDDEADVLWLFLTYIKVRVHLSPSNSLTWLQIFACRILCWVAAQVAQRSVHHFNNVCVSVSVCVRFSVCTFLLWSFCILQLHPSAVSLLETNHKWCFVPLDVTVRKKAVSTLPEWLIKKTVALIVCAVF